MTLGLCINLFSTRSCEYYTRLEFSGNWPVAGLWLLVKLSPTGTNQQLKPCAVCILRCCLCVCRYEHVTRLVVYRLLSSLDAGVGQV